MVKYTCPVCGWPGMIHSWVIGQTEGVPETCPSCAFNFGHQSTDDPEVIWWRFDWIAHGKPFRAQTTQPIPSDWDPDGQLDELNKREYTRPVGGPFTCPVCGYPNLDDPPRSESGGGSYEICDSCGFEFGYTDEAAGFTEAEWRARWVAEGMPFRSGDYQPTPDGWDPRRQLAALLDRGDEKPPS